jgi:hypothetical protein
MSNLLKLTTLTVLGLASLDQTLAAEAAAETGVGECLLRTGRGVTTPYLGNLKSGDEVPYSSRKVSSTNNPRHELTKEHPSNTRTWSSRVGQMTVTISHQVILNTILLEVAHIQFQVV